MSNPTISVLLIVYNHQVYLDEALTGILSQTYGDFELVVVDDGSHDESVQVVKKYQEQDPRIRLITQENCGPACAMNTGLANATGKYIAIQSGDDVSYPNRLETQLKQIQFFEADLIFSLPHIINQNSDFLDDEVFSIFFWRNFADTAELYNKLFYTGNFFCASSTFGRKEALDRIGGFRLGFMQLQDFDLMVRACQQNLSIKLLNERLIQYRVHDKGGNLSSQSNNARMHIEFMNIYRHYFDGISVEMLRDSFREKITLDAFEHNSDIELDKSFIYLSHPLALVRSIGAERLLDQIDQPALYEKLTKERGFSLPQFFRLLSTIDLQQQGEINALREQLSLLRKARLRNWKHELLPNLEVSG